MEPFVVQRLLSVLKSNGCGFVGTFPAGLTFAQDVRPDQQDVRFWEGSVEPEVVEVEGRNCERWPLHRTANLHHVAKELALPPGGFLRYKAAPTARASSTTERSSSRSAVSRSVTACRATTPAKTSSSRTCCCDATAAAGSPPSGTYHAEVETTTFSPTGAVEAEALDLLPELVEGYAPRTVRSP